jgi:hypothetical protein
MEIAAKTAQTGSNNRLVDDRNMKWQVDDPFVRQNALKGRAFGFDSPTIIRVDAYQFIVIGVCPFMLQEFILELFFLNHTLQQQCKKQVTGHQK